MKKYNKWPFFVVGVTALAMGFTACEDEPDKFELTDGKPTISYIRPQDVNAKDSLLTEAFTGSGICIVGENLTSIKEMYFNDIKAILNTSYITNHTMLVTVPGDIPASNTGKIYMINKTQDTTTYDFRVIVPGPSVTSMVCEHVPVGETAVVKGQYFVNDPNQPLTVTFTGINNSVNVPVTKINKITPSEIQFVVPEEAVEGQIEVTTIYGKALSKFYFNDRRNLITDFDGENHAGPTGVVPQGWNLKPTYSSEGGIPGCGNYCQVGPSAMDPDAGWFEDMKLSFWCGNWNGDPMSIKEGAGIPLRNFIDFSDWENMSFKMELCIPSSNPWQTGALQILFANNKQCANDGWQNNTYIHTKANGGLDLPRALYNPWKDNGGTFDTKGEWITVTIPLTQFIYNDDGSKAPAPMNPESFDSFVIWPKSGGVKGADCEPILRYDNIRVVPNL